MRVIVVGAGVAGLTAADAARCAGAEVLVLEARDRIGGRTWTVPFGPGAVDLGSDGVRKQARERRRRDARRPDLGPRRDALTGGELDPVGIDRGHRAVEERCHAERPQLPLRARGQLVTVRREYTVAGLDQKHTCLARVDVSIFAWEHIARELGDLARHLDTGRAGADDDERQPRLARGVVHLHLGRLEREQYPVA